MVEAPEKSAEAKTFSRKSREEDLTDALEQLQKDQETGQRYSVSPASRRLAIGQRTEFAPWIVALVGQKTRTPRLSQPPWKQGHYRYPQAITRRNRAGAGVTVDGS